MHVCLHCCPDDGYSTVAETVGTIIIIKIVIAMISVL